MRITTFFLIALAGLMFSQSSFGQSNDCNFNTSFSYSDSLCYISIIPSNNGAVSYFWDFGDGNTSNDNHPFHHYSSPGSYSVTMLVYNDTCADTIVQTVTIEPCSVGCHLEAGFIFMDSSQCETSFTPINYNPLFSYSWDFGDGNSSNLHDPYHVYSTYGSYNVTLIVSNDTCADTITQTVNVPPCSLPCNLNPTFSYYDSACYTGFIPNQTDTLLSYFWDFGDGSTASGYTQEHMYDTSGVYYVTLSISDGNCTDTIVQTVTIEPCSVGCHLEAGFIFMDSSQCETSFTPINYNPLFSYSWDFGDGNSSNLHDPYHVYSTYGSYNVTLIVSNDTCADTITQTVNVPPCSLPCNLNPTFSYYDSACYTGFIPNQTDTLLSYFWDFGDGSTASGYTQEHMYDTSGVYYVTLSISDGNCTDTIQQTVNAIACSPCPIDASFTTVGNGANTYDFSPATFNASYSYHWIFGDGTVSTDANVTHTFANEEDYFVTLVVSDCNCSASETIVLNVTDSINCNYNGDFTYTIESDGSYTFTPVYQSSNYEYYWLFGDGSSANTMESNYTFLLNGNYNVSLNIWEPGNSSCSDTTEQNITVTGASYCQLNSNFTIHTDSNNNHVHFYPDVYNSNYSYEWDFGDGQASNFHSPNHSYSNQGIYEVILNVYFDSCHSSDTVNVNIMTASLNNIQGSETELNIYPNPTSDFIYLDFKSLSREHFQILLIDSNGKLIKQEAFVTNEGGNHKKIGVQSISRGVYQIALQKEDGTFIHRTRFIKH